jgi:hypothetical protein
MLRSLLLAIPALLAMTACEYRDRSHYHDDEVTDGFCGAPIRRAVIDTDATLEVVPAEGVGVFVEYASGGHWHVYTSCDTDRSGSDCLFDIVVQPLGQSKISSVSPDDLESEDEMSLVGDDAVHLVARTDYDLDGFFLDTDAGAVLSVDAYLDNVCTNYVFWAGDGAVHEGAPSAPMEFLPSVE